MLIMHKNLFRLSTKILTTTALMGGVLLGAERASHAVGWFYNDTSFNLLVNGESVPANSTSSYSLPANPPVTVVVPVAPTNPGIGSITSPSGGVLLNTQLLSDTLIGVTSGSPLSCPKLSAIKKAGPLPKSASPLSNSPVDLYITGCPSNTQTKVTLAYEPPAPPPPAKPILTFQFNNNTGDSTHPGMPLCFGVGKPNTYGEGPSGKITPTLNRGETASLVIDYPEKLDPANQQSYIMVYTAYLCKTFDGLVIPAKAFKNNPALVPNSTVVINCDDITDDGCKYTIVPPNK